MSNARWDGDSWVWREAIHGRDVFLIQYARELRWIVDRQQHYGATLALRKKWPWSKPETEDAAMERIRKAVWASTDKPLPEPTHPWIGTIGERPKRACSVTTANSVPQRQEKDRA